MHVSVFEPTRIYIDGRPHRASKAICSSCGRADAVAINSKKGAPNPPEEDRQATRKFQKDLGWVIGNRPSEHLCRDCREQISRINKEAREERLGMRQINGRHYEPGQPLHLPAKPVAALHAPQPELPQPQPEPTPEPAAPAAPLEVATSQAPPRPSGPSREERRLIFAQLEDVYVNETEGYKAGWSDGRVARELGYPTDWVKVVRDENFGALPDNPEFRALVEEANGIFASIKETAAEVQGLAEAIDVDGLSEKLEMLSKIKQGIAFTQRLAAQSIDIEARFRRLLAQNE
jgi:hypothetical protein